MSDHRRPPVERLTVLLGVLMTVDGQHVYINRNSGLLTIANKFGGRWVLDNSCRDKG